MAEQKLQENKEGRGSGNEGGGGVAGAELCWVIRVGRGQAAVSQRTEPVARRVEAPFGRMLWKRVERLEGVWEKLNAPGGSAVCDVGTTVSRRDVDIL